MGRTCPTLFYKVDFFEVFLNLRRIRCYKWVVNRLNRFKALAHLSL